MSLARRFQFDLVDLLGLTALAALGAHATLIVLDDSFQLGWVYWPVIGVFPAASLLLMRAWVAFRGGSDCKQRIAGLLSPLFLSSVLTVFAYFGSGFAIPAFHYGYATTTWAPFRDHIAAFASNESPHAMTPYIIGTCKAFHMMCIYSAIPIVCIWGLLEGAARLFTYVRATNDRQLRQ